MICVLVRATDESRERAVAELRAGCVAGSLSPDTFELRLGRALIARTEAELRSLVIDVPTAPLWLQCLRRWFGGDASGAERSVEVSLPRGAGPLVLGRSSACDVVLHDGEVSRHHAELRRADGRCWLTDLHSSNGTWVNGVRVDRVQVHAGDVAHLAGLLVRLT